ncbi:MAG: hypothetical protein ACFFAE_19345, partial [Candidatus Hodarchaeota archaeon]
RRRPQALEVYAHVIVSLAAESLLNTPFLTSQSLDNPHFNTRVYRAKRQFFEMLTTLQKEAKPSTKILLWPSSQS